MSNMETPLKFMLSVTKNEFDIIKLRHHNYPETANEFRIVAIHRDFDISKEAYFLEIEVDNPVDIYCMGRWIGYFNKTNEVRYGTQDYSLNTDFINPETKN